MMQRCFVRPCTCFCFCLLLAAGLLSGGCSRPPQPRAVILLVGDGLGSAQIALARQAILPLGQRFELEQLPVTALMSTWSASNPVTDSAAAATTLASGVKTDNLQGVLDNAEVPLRLVELLGWELKQPDQGGAAATCQPRPLQP